MSIINVGDLFKGDLNIEWEGQQGPISTHCFGSSAHALTFWPSGVAHVLNCNKKAMFGLISDIQHRDDIFNDNKTGGMGGLIDALIPGDQFRPNNNQGKPVVPNYGPNTGPGEVGWPGPWAPGGNTGNGGGCGCKPKGPKKDKCRQYTPEEKRDYYEKKCREREAVKESGICKRVYKKRATTKGKKKTTYKRKPKKAPFQGSCYPMIN